MLAIFTRIYIHSKRHTSDCPTYIHIIYMTRNDDPTLIRPHGIHPTHTTQTNEFSVNSFSVNFACSCNTVSYYQQNVVSAYATLEADARSQFSDVIQQQFVCFHTEAYTPSLAFPFYLRKRCKNKVFKCIFFFHLHAHFLLVARIVHTYRAFL